MIFSNIQSNFNFIFGQFSVARKLIISPNEVFGDIMVLASPPCPPPVDPDDVNALTRKIFNGSLSKFI